MDVSYWAMVGPAVDAKKYMLEEAGFLFRLLAPWEVQQALERRDIDLDELLREHMEMDDKELCRTLCNPDAWFRGDPASMARWLAAFATLVVRRRNLGEDGEVDAHCVLGRFIFDHSAYNASFFCGCEGKARGG